MARRELSSTLRNLKFMQRGINKEENPKKEEEAVVPDGNFPSVITTKKCLVIMEGDPSPGAIKGRISFQSFNPSIDKLNEETANPRQSEDVATCSENQGGKMSNRENGSARDRPETLKEETSNMRNISKNPKRKQAETVQNEFFSNITPKIVESDLGFSSSMKKTRKQAHEGKKLDWNILRSPMSRSKRG